MGSDCALDMTSVDAICVNLRQFFEWVLRPCRTGGVKRLETLDRRCEIVRRRQAQNQAAASGLRKGRKGSRKN